MRCWNLPVSLAAKFSIAQVIGQQENNVGLLCGEKSIPARNASKRQEQERERNRPAGTLILIDVHTGSRVKKIPLHGYLPSIFLLPTDDSSAPLRLFISTRQLLQQDGDFEYP
jgi:hypothetical protein